MPRFLSGRRERYLSFVFGPVSILWGPCFVWASCVPCRQGACSWLLQLGSSFLVLGECSCVTTLQGCLIARLGEALERSSGMTLSRVDLVFVWLREKCSAT